jgi:TfoX/Sxy family transcriptional regulator of competence genes
MSTDNEFIEHIANQARGAGQVSYREMLGEYALYLDGKVVALVFDNQLFVKPTEAGRLLLGTPSLVPPYPGAKDHFLVDSEVDDNERLAELLRATADALPPPKKTHRLKKRP